MDHKQVQQDLIDQYLMGKLPEEENFGFEEHFVDCPECIAQIQLTKSFLQDLRFVAAEVLQTDTHRRGNAFWHTLQTVFRKPLVLAACCLLIAIAACVVFVANYTQRLRAEVNQAKSLSDQWEHRYEEERQAAISAQKEHQETERQLNEQSQTLSAKLRDEQAQRERMKAEFSQWIRPAGNLPIFVLTPKRSGEQKPSESANPITLPRSATMFAFSILLEGEVTYKSYKITIIDRHNRLIWKKEGLTPDRHNSFSIGFKPGFFQPGNYSLILKGINNEGIGETVGYYPFLVIKTR